MRFPRKSVFFCLAAVASLALSGQAFATTFFVGTCRTTPYTTIQAAVTAASAGDTVEVCPGSYPEQVLITQSLTLTGLQGDTNGLVEIVPPAGGLVQNGVDIYSNPVAAQVFVQGASSVKINHFVVDGTGNNQVGCNVPTMEGIYFQNSGGVIKNNTVSNQYQTDYADYGGCQNGLAINIESTTSSNSVLVEENSVRGYQKNGITADGVGTGPGSPGPVVTITQNAVVGLAATTSALAAENGIQVAYGASGTISDNVVDDNIYPFDPNTANAASGILVYASPGIQIIENRVGSAQFAIAVDSDPTAGTADGTIITDNKVVGNQLYDAIDLCSSSNVVTSNLVFNSTQSGIHIDDSCVLTSNNNTVTGNTVHDSCAGILVGLGTGNTISPNTFYTVSNTTLAGDTCPAALLPVSPTSANRSTVKLAHLHASPYKPTKK